MNKRVTNPSLELRHYMEKNQFTTAIKRTTCLFILTMLLSSVLSADNRNRFDPWLVYYSNEATIDSFSPYRMLVLDSDFHPPLADLKARGKLLLGYISLGEVEFHRAYFAEVKRQGILLDENPFWKNSYFIDMRQAYWPKKVITTLIPQILEKGFDGIFLDTLDNPLHLENQDPVRYRGMKDAAARLVKGIRLHFPYIKIMMNRAYGLIDEVSPYIDMILGESVYADYDPANKDYRLVEPSLYEFQIEQLRKAVLKNPDIGLYTLDYWNPDDQDMLRKIYHVQRQNGFIPHVSTILLNRIIKEPK